MPTFREEVEGAYELIEGALSQVTVNGVALRYIDRLPKIAVALGQPLSGPGRAANRQALLRILKRALSKFHEDKRAIAKARGEEISEYTEWMRAMVSQALLVAKEALEEDDFPFPAGNAPTGAFTRAVVGAAWLERTMAKGRPRWRRRGIWIRGPPRCAPGLGQGEARLDAP